MADAPVFDPAKPYEAVESPAPQFDPSQPFEAVDLEPPPRPFLERLAYGRALDRVLAPYVAAAKGAAEAFGGGPGGFSPETVRTLQDLGFTGIPSPAAVARSAFSTRRSAKELSAR